MAQGRDYRLVNRESEGERGDRVVSEKSEKRAERGESGGLVVVSCLTYIGYPPQLRALPENFENFMKNFIMKNLYDPHENLIKNPQI